MVISCVAYGCHNEQDRRKISFHSFPFKRPEILELWIKAIRRENWTPSKTSKICGEHFLPSDFVDKPGLTVKLLKPDAVPNVFSFPKHLLPKTATMARRKVLKQELPNDTEIMDIDAPSTSTATIKVLADKETQTSVRDSAACLRRKVKSLKQKVKRRDVKLGIMKEIIHTIKESGHSKESLDAVLGKYFQGLPLE